MTEPHELISAHLDGELDTDEHARVARAVAEDPALAHHANELSKVRDHVRGLPPVDPPFGILERIVLDLRRYRPSRSLIAATWGAAAAAVVLVVAVAPSVSPPEIAPDVDELAARQEVVATQPIAAVRPSTEFAEIPVDAVAPEVPDDLGGTEATAAFEGGEVTQVVYGQGERATSVFVQEGEVDWSELADHGGERVTIAGDPAWRSTISPESRRGPDDDPLLVVVVDRGGVVVVAVGAAMSDAVEADLAGFGEPPTSWSDDVVDACGGVAETFGFDL